MTFSFEIINKKGDRIIVSLSSLFQYTKELLPNKFSEIEIIEINIEREAPQEPIQVEILSRIADELIKFSEDNPNAIFYYFCDTTQEIPFKRNSRKDNVQSYRNRLFSLLFERFNKKATETWADQLIELYDRTTESTLYTHLLIRKKFFPITEIFKKEINNNFQVISEQK